MLWLLRFIGGCGEKAVSLELPDAGVILVPVAVHNGIGQALVAVVLCTDGNFIPHGFAAAKVHITQRGAAVKGMSVNFLYGLGNIDISQGDTALKYLAVDL